MRKDFFPDRESEMMSWVKGFAQKILIDPELYSLTIQQAEDFDAARDAFTQAFLLAKNPGTRTRPVIAQKREKRKILEAEARKLSRIIQGSPTVTDAQKIALGLSVRTNHGAPRAAPEMPPLLNIVEVLTRGLRVRLRDAESPDNHGRPRTAAGAMIYTHVGETPSSDINKWSMHSVTTKRTADINLSSDVPPGARYWVTAVWFSPRGARSPMSTPVSARMMDGLGVIAAGLAKAA